MELIVITSIITRKLSITSEEIQEEYKRLTDKDSDATEGSSVQPANTGADVDHQ